AKEDPTLEVFIKKYLTDYAPKHKKPRTVAEDKRNLEAHVVPALGHLRLADVSRADVARFHAGRSKFPVNANRCITTLGHVFTIREKWGYRGNLSNPCRGIDKFEEKPRERMLSAAELARLGDALTRATTGWTDEEWRIFPEKKRPKRQAAEDYRAVA